MSPGTVARPYAPRRITPLEPVQRRGWMIKRYGISAARKAPLPQVIEVGLDAVDRTLPEAYPTAPSYALNITHEDGEGCYFVVGWWTPNRLIMSTRTWISEWDDPYGLRDAPDRMTACVWELAVISHENEAWIKHMLSAEVPDFDAYLSSVIAGLR